MDDGSPPRSAAVWPANELVRAGAATSSSWPLTTSPLIGNRSPVAPDGRRSTSTTSRRGCLPATAKAPKAKRSRSRRSRARETAGRALIALARKQQVDLITTSPARARVDPGRANVRSSRTRRPIGATQQRDGRVPV